MSDGYPRKLIEVALPLREISKASVADKNRKVGTIKNLHKWFAPMPTPALRALDLRHARQRSRQRSRAGETRRAHQGASPGKRHRTDR